MHTDNFFFYILICLSGLIMYLGIKLANYKLKNIFGVCLANEKTSLYHDPLIRGLGILYLFALSPLFIFSQQLLTVSDILIIVCSSLLGFYDDKFGITQIKKIVLLITMFLIIELILTNYLDLNFLYFCVKIILFLFFTLFFNQIDGINGLAGSTFILSCCGILILLNDLISIELILALILVTIVYLQTNFKGNIGIQGEAGSFFMGSFVFVFSQKLNNSQDLTYFLMFLFPILSDIISTTLIRLWYVKNIFLSHRNHLYQRLVNKNKNHFKTTMYFAIAQIFTILITVLFYNLSYSPYKLLSSISFILIIVFINLRFSFLIHKERF